MRLPDGVSVHPKESVLIAKSAPAWIRIDVDGYKNNSQFRINNRSFAAISPYLHGDWADVAFGNAPPRTIYSGADHAGDPALPNITIVPNIYARKASRPVFVLGCTMGHYHLRASEARVQELYEFQSHGMLVLDQENGAPDLWVARPGDKVAVPNACHMTLYNLGGGDEPLVTLDFGDPDRNNANKVLIAQAGPILLGYYDDVETTFMLSRLYINNGSTHSAGVQLRTTPTDDERRVVIRSSGVSSLGQFLYSELTGNSEVIAHLSRLGVHIRRASPDVVPGNFADLNSRSPAIRHAWI